MSFLKDSLSIFKRSELAFLKRHKESEDVYTFVFDKGKGLTWNAGQHGLFTITHKKLKDSTRPLSVASSPLENTIQITTEISENPSDFKKALLELEEGMKISMSGPVGSFYVKDKSPSLFIANGIGITPFRAILKQLESEGTQSENHVKLLYLDQKKTFIFQDELDDIANNTSIDISYLDEENLLNQEIEDFISTYKNTGKYFVAGSKARVDTVTTHLKNNHISKQNIKKHVFTGIK